MFQAIGRASIQCIANSLNISGPAWLSYPGVVKKKTKNSVGCEKKDEEKNGDQCAGC